ncbi:MAG: AAA family ATPase [Oscillatoria sp. Prado101]|jgi:hypothetical protein|nr:AAA family ATPase [Oscillatoria sp. Prado101]
MSGIYLRECLIENVGPIESFDVSLELNPAGEPKPVILVGKNGTGKTIVLAYIIDALAELAKKAFTDVVVGQQLGSMRFLKFSSGADSRYLSGTCLSLLEFSDSDTRFGYVEKIGKIDPQQYTTKLGDRFTVPSWPIDEPFYKFATGDKKQIETFFYNGSVCFFPSSRHELPHWLNVDAVTDQPLFGNYRQLMGYLGKPLVVERSAVENQQWLMDVLLDSLVEGDFVINPEPATSEQRLCWQPRFNWDDKIWLKAGRQNVEKLLCRVIEDESAKIVLNYRNAGQNRVAIRLGNGVIVPSLTHLSAGQALLFNVFATIIRYADRADLNKSIELNQIEGIVLIDEIDAHLHTDLQYGVLPRLIKLFPKVQFIVTSHSPLFLLGMEREFGPEGIQIMEMPTGRNIGTERFEEFRRSFDYYSQTRTFEENVERRVLETTKPLVFMEGKTDVLYLTTALELLGHSDLLEGLEIDEIGQSGKEGTKGGGQANLDIARKFLENNKSRFPRWVLLIYDCDTKKKSENVGRIWIRSISQNPDNTKATKGIENLLPTDLLKDDFYNKVQRQSGDGGEITETKLQKDDLCQWVCHQRRNRDDFLEFDSLLVPIIREFFSAATA